MIMYGLFLYFFQNTFWQMTHLIGSYDSYEHCRSALYNLATSIPIIDLSQNLICIKMIAT